MPKYTTDIIAGYTLYFTSKCIIEAMHVHASDKKLTEAGSAKLFVFENGDTKIENYGCVSKSDMNKIHKEMYEKWSRSSTNGYYHG